MTERAPATAGRSWREDEFDVIHFHVELIHFPFFGELAHKTLRETGAQDSSRNWRTRLFEKLAHKTMITLQGRLDLKDLSEAYARWPQYPLVSISNDQRRPLPVVSQFEIRRP